MWFSARFAEPTRQKAITWDVWAISVPAISELTRQATAAVPARRDNSLCIKSKCQNNRKYIWEAGQLGKASQLA